MAKIDLGEDMGAMMASVPVKSEKEKCYPTVHLCRDTPLPFKAGDEGEADIEFCVKSSSESTNEEGETKYSYCLEIKTLEIDSEAETESELPSNRGKEAEDALDALVAEYKSSKEKY